MMACVNVSIDPLSGGFDIFFWNIYCWPTWHEPFGESGKNKSLMIRGEGGISNSCVSLDLIFSFNILLGQGLLIALIRIQWVTTFYSGFFAEFFLFCFTDHKFLSRLCWWRLAYDIHDSQSRHDFVETLNDHLDQEEKHLRCAPKIVS